MQMDETRHRYRQYTTGTLPRGVEWIVGIDEVGRGPLAGPVTIGATLFPRRLYVDAPYVLKDSKQLTERARKEWYAHMLSCRRRSDFQMTVASSSPAYIDTHGITAGVRAAIARALAKLDVHPDTTLVLLDGLLRAPARFPHQRTIIRGDEREPLIALASIFAKVSRDRLMTRMAKRYPAYGFDRHKGYGTQLHRSAIEKHGPCDIHRQSFI